MFLRLIFASIPTGVAYWLLDLAPWAGQGFGAALPYFVIAAVVGALVLGEDIKSDEGSEFLLGLLFMGIVVWFLGLGVAALIRQAIVVL